MMALVLFGGFFLAVFLFGSMLPDNLFGMQTSRRRWTPNKSTYGDYGKDWKHGQPLSVQTFDEFFNTGTSRTVYWDALKYDTVDCKDKLSVLTEHQKTWVKVYK